MLTLLQPLRLQARMDDFGSVSSAALARMTATLALPGDQALIALQALHERLCAEPCRPLPSEFGTGTNLKRISVIELDDYMQIFRVDADAPAPIWLRSITEAQMGWLSLLAKANSDTVELQRVALGFRAMHQLTARALGAVLESPQPHPSLLSARTSSFESHELLTVWRKGHWIFFVLTQALVIAFKRLANALQIGDIAGSKVELSSATELFWASGAAMTLTGAFTNEQYHSDVRPTMTLGADKALVKNTSLSGAMTWDHHYLVNRVWREELMPLLGAMQDDVKDLYPEFLRAYREGLSTGHRAVCAKFGGETMGSLVAPNHIATELLDSIESTRLAQLSLDRGAKSSVG